MVPVEYLDHTADVALRGIGTTVEEAFSEAARAMFGVMVDLELVSPVQRIQVEAHAEGLDLLLVEWLSSLLAKKDIAGLVLSRFRVRIEQQERGSSLWGEGWGETLDPERHGAKTEVKGVSYAGLRVWQENERWIAQCVIDI